MIKKTLLAATLLPFLAQAQTVPPAEKPELYDIGAAMSAERMKADVTKLVSFGTRHTLSSQTSKTRGIGAATDWIEAQFKAISKECGGCLEVIRVSDTVSGEKRIPNPTLITNVIAIKWGSEDKKRMALLSGDIDSRVTDVMNATADAPGANDNASGIAATLESARVLTKYDFPGTIVFSALSAEEQGLFGGKILAKYAREQGWNIDAVINNDMIGNTEGIDGIKDNHTVRVFSEGTRAVETATEARTRRFTGGELDSPSRNLGRYIKALAHQYLPMLDVMMVYRLDRFGRGGHHSPFNDAGYPGVRLMETHENYNRQHQDLRTENGVAYGDVLTGVDFDYARKVAALDAITLASMAWAPTAPAGVTIKGAVSPDTTLSWQAGKDKQLAGYKVYWRLTTEPTWTHSRYVGNTDSYTLKGVVIDNYFFGVAAVAKDGTESPVVFPGAAGAF
ncbi:M20/M25/M40 family metallo-hydrolase [Gallaecimonas pentaromativorans]|uniref:Fibronectin type III domain protein n=1 Tax=Gallaecimonas pentaromativorans TaxID=584787 RepID=A0A3N1PJP7_9GAMM|nr:M20/M25/M40 family metallo-hydrolase [Gallaecimonas pentaromativorans]ROQ27431.1 fibronectin type III domain protein [Gallaecimonas pentaromativorans]